MLLKNVKIIYWIASYSHKDIPWCSNDIPLGCISWGMKLKAFIQQKYTGLHFVPDTVLDAEVRTVVETALELFMKDTDRKWL